jgi:hypothetical protein
MEESDLFAVLFPLSIPALSSFARLRMTMQEKIRRSDLQGQDFGARIRPSAKSRPTVLRYSAQTLHTFTKRCTANSRPCSMACKKYTPAGKPSSDIAT